MDLLASSPLRIVSLCVLGAALLVSVVTDIRSRTIYNWVTFPAIGLGLVLQTAAGWGETLPWFADYGWRSGLAGFGVGFGVYFVIYLLTDGGMGEGDVKLMGAVGALAGLKVAIAAVLTIAVVGGVQALLYLLRKRMLGKTLKGMAQDAAAKVGVGEKTEREKTYVPYGVAIAIGTVWAYWWVLTQERAALAALQAAGG